MSERGITMAKTIREILNEMSDADLIEMLRYIRDENGERMSLIELRHFLRESANEEKGSRS